MVANHNTVLIVDDEESVLAILANYLNTHGFKTLIAIGAEAALELLQHTTPDIILLDILLPDADGFEFATQLKNVPQCRDVPILFLTALTKLEHKVKGFQVGAVDYITKPLHMEEVLARLNTHLTLRRLQQELQEKNRHLQHEIAKNKRFEQKIQHRLDALTAPDMPPEDIRFEELVDVGAMQALLDNLYEAAGLPASILNRDEEILAAAGWQKACTHFHRAHPEMCVRCKESDTYIKSHLPEGDGYVAYRCANGLWDMAIPIRIQDQHVATFFFGQVFLEEEPPDMAFFREQARCFDLDESDYLAAIEKVPVVSRDQVNKIMVYYKNLADLIATMGLKNLSQARTIAERQRAEEALRASEERFRTVFESAQDFIFIKDRTLRYTQVNPATEKLFELPASQLIGKTDLELFGPKAGAHIEAVDARVLNGEIVDEEYCKPVNGVPTTFHVIKVPMRDHKGQIVGLCGIARDVSERAEMEAALRRSEKRYQAIVEEQMELVQRFTPDGRITFVNQAACRYYGKTRDELLGVACLEFVKPADRPVVRQRIDAISLDNPLSPGENRITSASGEERWTRWTNRGIFDEDGTLVEIQAVGRDITERKRAEEALRKSEREKALILSAVSDMVAYYQSPALEIVWANKGAADSVTQSASSLSGRHCYKVWHQRTAPCSGCPVLRVFETDTYQEAEVTTPDGRFWSLRCNPVYDEDGTLVGVVEVGQNITERKRAESKLRESEARYRNLAEENAHLLEQARHDAETKARLLQEVNHRVKNNLDAIIGLLYVKRRYVSPEVLPAFQHIMDDLVNRVMGLAKVHSLLSASEWTPLLLSDLAAHIIRTTLEVTSDRVEAAVDISPSPVRVTPEQAHHLALVIVELATNTLKYALGGPAGVHIAVAIARDGDTVTLTYRDNGPGYAEETLRLEQLQAGLDIVHKIVSKNLRGSLTLCNDGGAVAVICFKANALGGA